MSETFRRFKVVLIEDDPDQLENVKIIGYGVHFPDDSCAIRYAPGRTIAALTLADVEESLSEDDGSIATALEWID